MPVSKTPYGCWRIYLTADGKPSHIIRNLGDGRQQKLHAETHEVIDTYGFIGGGNKGHYRKQKTEKPLLMPGDSDKADVVREIFRLHLIEGMGGKRIADVLNSKGIPRPEGQENGVSGRLNRSTRSKATPVAALEIANPARFITNAIRMRRKKLNLIPKPMRLH